MPSLNSAGAGRRAWPTAGHPAWIVICMTLLVALLPQALPAAPPGRAAAGPPSYHLVRVSAAGANLQRVAELGIAVEHAVAGDGFFEVTVDDAELAALQSAALPYTVLVEDLAAFYAARAAAESSLWDAAARAAQTTGFGFGSMGGYYTRAEVLAKLDEMRADYPSLISEKQVFTITMEGRDIQVVKISDNPDLDEGEPAMLYTALTHAREPQGMATVVYFMFHLLENYATDPEVRYLVDNRELYFMPVFNVDGYLYNESTNPNGGGMWRKDRRNNGDGTYGVDLNRNYGYMWGHDNTGSSPNTSSQTYRGPAAFSEFETAGMRLFHQTHTINNSFHYHSYGNLEIHPFGYQADALPPGDDYQWYLLYGMDITAMNGYTLGNAWQTVHYLTNGDAVDWSYGEQVEKNKVFALTPEVGSSSDGFWPAPSRIVPLAEENLGPNLYQAWQAGGRLLMTEIAAGPEVPRGELSDVVVTAANTGLAAATDGASIVSSADPYVIQIVNPPSFPAVPAHDIVGNAAEPNRIEVAPDAPLGHAIELTVTLEQGGLVRGQMTVQVTVVEGTTAVAAGAAPRAPQVALAAHPNPFNPSTELVLEMARAERARLAIYDARGRLVRVLVDGERPAGRLRVAFDGRDGAGRRLASGVYVARLETAAGATASTRLVLVQ